MKPEDRHARLEAYLSGELAPGDVAEFAADVNEREVAARRVFGEAARSALGGGVPDDIAEVAVGAVQRAGACPSLRLVARRRVSQRVAVVLAAAATIALAVVTPRLLRDQEGAAGPRSTITRSGQVVAVRFGEVPGAAVALEAGCLDQSAGVCQP